MYTKVFGAVLGLIIGWVVGVLLQRTVGWIGVHSILVLLVLIAGAVLGASTGGIARTIFGAVLGAIIGLLAVRLFFLLLKATTMILGASLGWRLGARTRP